MSKTGDFFLDLYTPPPPPAKPHPTSRKKAGHPEAAREQIGKRAAATSEDVPKSWRIPGGYVVRLDVNPYDRDALRLYRTLDPPADYKDAVALRDAEMATGRYMAAWIFQR